jgi:hypothetical protein
MRCGGGSATLQPTLRRREMNGQLVCLLQGLVRALNFHKKPIYNFVQLHPVRPNTRAKGA